MRLKENIAISESGFLFNPNTGESYSLNPSGREILKLISEGKDRDEIFRIIQDAYSVSTQSLHRYLDDFLVLLQRFELIELDEHE